MSEAAYGMHRRRHCGRSHGRGVLYRGFAVDGAVTWLGSFILRLASRKPPSHESIGTAVPWVTAQNKSPGFLVGGLGSVSVKQGIDKKDHGHNDKAANQKGQRITHSHRSKAPQGGMLWQG